MDNARNDNHEAKLPVDAVTRRQFLKNAWLAAGGLATAALALATACKKAVTQTTTITSTTTTTTTAPTSSTPPTSVRLPPVNGLEYLVNSDPATVDNSTLPVTPPELLHVLNPSPEVDIDSYRLNVHGAVDNPLSLSYADLQQFTMTQQTVLLICPTVFADNETLSGIPLTTLMDATGVHSDAVQLVFHSLDNLQENIDLTDTRIPGMLLALTVDGQPLSQGHGFPIRLVRPGQVGVFWLKCLSEIEVV